MSEELIDFLSSEYHKYRIEEYKFHELASFIQTNLIDNLNKKSEIKIENTKENIRKINDLMDSVSDYLVDVNAVVIYLKKLITKHCPKKSQEIINKPVEYTIDTKFKEQIDSISQEELKKEKERLNKEMLEFLFNQKYNEFIETKQKIICITKKIE